MNTLTFTHRPAAERGGMDLGWLQARYSFSFADYRDPNHMRFANLRVLNDDIVQAGQGFGMHPHQNAEIFSYILEGALAHKDSMGNGSVVSAGGIQYMSAGRGVRHSEFNPSKVNPTRLLQVWLLPAVTGTEPRYQNFDFDVRDKDGKLKLFLSNDGREGSIHTHAKADVYCATLDGEQEIRQDFPVNSTVNKQVWIQMAKGSMTVNGFQLEEGDGLAIELVDDGVNAHASANSSANANSNSSAHASTTELVFANGVSADFLYFELG